MDISTSSTLEGHSNECIKSLNSLGVIRIKEHL